ncbi:MAG: MBL fold metallo-hydrolase [Clostridia bacterium]|nr:MBL fold metallo-hydrolase [Clostridia bacterium]
MRLNILGTGHGTATECYNTCFTISNGVEHFLVDAGGGNGILKQLKSSKIEIENIKNIFVSHIHMDHLLGVLWIIRIFARKFYKKELIEPVKIYGNDEVISALNKICEIVIPKDFLFLLNDKIKFIEVKTNDRVKILDFDVEFIDLSAKKVKQFGFVIKKDDVNLFTFIGDEVCSANTEKYLNNTKWLFADAYMAGEEAERHNPIERHHHSTVKYVAEMSERLNVENLVLSHTIDNDLKNRKEKFTNDAKKYFKGNIFVPDDLEIIEIEEEL